MASIDLRRSTTDVSGSTAATKIQLQDLPLDQQVLEGAKGRVHSWHSACLSLEVEQEGKVFGSPEATRGDTD